MTRRILPKINQLSLSSVVNQMNDPTMQSSPEMAMQNAVRD